MKRKQKLQYMLMIILACIINHGFAQLIRSFPIESQLGKLQTHAFPEFKIDGKKMYMGAGGQIRDINNLLVLPVQLNQTGYIRYQLDNMGFIHRIWFLSKEEVQLAKEEEKLLK